MKATRIRTTLTTTFQKAAKILLALALVLMVVCLPSQPNDKAYAAGVPAVGDKLYGTGTVGPTVHTAHDQSQFFGTTLDAQLPGSFDSFWCLDIKTHATSERRSGTVTVHQDFFMK